MRPHAWPVALLAVTLVGFTVARGVAQPSGERAGSPDSARTQQPAAPQTEVAGATYVGSETCGGCHAAEFDSWRASAHGHIERDADVLGAGVTGCESCHGPGSLHVAAGGDSTVAGFRTIHNPARMGAAASAAACRSCHQAGEQFYWDHSPHARAGVSCTGCHSIHHAKSQGAARLLRQPDTNDQCLSCHRSKRVALARSGHMPLREGGMTCNDCHNPHGTASEHLVRADTPNDLCTKCHADKRGPFLWEHPPVRENCMTCHEPHGSNNAQVLAGRRPFLCQRCHITTRHPATLYDAPDLVSNRLFNRSCTNCHVQIHGSNHPSGRSLLR